MNTVLIVLFLASLSSALDATPLMGPQTVASAECEEKPRDMALLSDVLRALTALADRVEQVAAKVEHLAELTQPREASTREVRCAHLVGSDGR